MMQEANDVAWEDLAVGQTAEFSWTVTEDMMKAFRALSGDANPLHVDAAYAKAQGYPGPVVYGMCTASLYSQLAGMYLPGKRCLLQSVHADFLRPVFVGDVLRVSGEIIEKNDSVRQIVVRAAIRNQDGKKVSRVKMEAGVLG